MRIPVYCGDYCIELADPARARRLQAASNTETVRRKCDGAVMQINMLDEGDDYLKRASRGNPLKYTYLDRSELMPQGVHSMKHLATETGDLYRQVQTDCMIASQQ